MGLGHLMVRWWGWVVVEVFLFEERGVSFGGTPGGRGLLVRAWIPQAA